MTSPFQLTPGAVVGGDFRVQELLSAGGMGAVYISVQQSTGKRRALKVMHPQLVADPRQRERFEQEARVGALIESSHVVEVIAAGVEGDSGVPWIAMELLDGQDLGAYAASHGCLTPDELLDVMRQMCHALGAAHTAGVVHRDIKPENVFLARSQTASAGVSIKVLDFGIAKVAAQAKTTATATVGSPAWMAPEQTDPRAPITPATDVWAVGLMAFWLLSGRSFWLAVHDPHASMHALMREILFSDIPSASARATELGVEERLFDGFDAWFARCVHRKPEKRYSSASVALEAFERTLSGDRTVVHTSMPPSSSPLSLAHGETLAMVTGDVIHRKQATPTQPMPPPDHINRTASPTVADSFEPRTRTGSRRGVAIGVGGLVAGAALVVMLGRLEPGAATAQNHQPTPEIWSAPKREPPPSPQPSPVTDPSTAPSAAKSAPAIKGPAPDRRPPFDHNSARWKMDAMTSSASRCPDIAGSEPTIVTVTVTWNNDGTAKAVTTSAPRFSTAEGCVQSTFRNVLVAPFSGPSGTLAAGVPITPYKSR